MIGLVPFRDLLSGAAPAIVTPMSRPDEFSWGGHDFRVVEPDNPYSLAVPVQQPRLIEPDITPEEFRRADDTAYLEDASDWFLFTDLPIATGAMNNMETTSLFLAALRAEWARHSLIDTQILQSAWESINRAYWPVWPHANQNPVFSVPIEGDDESCVPANTIDVLVDFARNGLKQDFYDLAGCAGVPAKQHDELWTGTRRRLGLESA